MKEALPATAGVNAGGQGTGAMPASVSCATEIRATNGRLPQRA